MDSAALDRVVRSRDALAQMAEDDEERAQVAALDGSEWNDGSD